MSEKTNYEIIEGGKIKMIPLWVKLVLFEEVFPDSLSVSFGNYHLGKKIMRTVGVYKKEDRFTKKIKRIERNKNDT